MRTNLFLESATEHAERIGLPEDRTRMLRLALALKQDGYPPESILVQLGAADDNWLVAMSTQAALEHELAVIWEDDCYMPPRGIVLTAPAQTSAYIEQPQTAGDKKLLLAQYGLYKGKQPPFGYLFDCEVRIQTADGQAVTGHSLIPDPDTVTIVDDIFTEFIDGVSLKQIVAGLNICGVHSPEKPYWDAAQVRTIVRRAPLYAGFIVYHNGKHKPARGIRILYPGRHAALIDLETSLTVLAITGRTRKWDFASLRATADETEE